MIADAVTHLIHNLIRVSVLLTDCSNEVAGAMLARKEMNGCTKLVVLSQILKEKALRGRQLINFCPGSRYG